MRVVEIGAGLAPGPRIKAASEHIIVDTIPGYSRQMACYAHKFQALESDGRTLDIEDGTVDMVLFHNVFGDPELGLTESRKRMTDMSLELGRQGEGLDLYRYAVARNKREVVGMKIGLLEEGLRIKRPDRPDGLGVVEDYTAIIAETSFPDIEQGVSQAHRGGRFVTANLAAVTDTVYAQSQPPHCQTWTWNARPDMK